MPFRIRSKYLILTIKKTSSTFLSLETVLESLKTKILKKKKEKKFLEYLIIKSINLNLFTVYLKLNYSVDFKNPNFLNTDSFTVEISAFDNTEFFQFLCAYKNTFIYSNYIASFAIIKQIKFLISNNMTEQNNLTKISDNSLSLINLLKEKNIYFSNIQGYTLLSIAQLTKNFEHTQSILSDFSLSLESKQISLEVATLIPFENFNFLRPHFSPLVQLFLNSFDFLCLSIIPNEYTVRQFNIRLNSLLKNDVSFSKSSNAYCLNKRWLRKQSVEQPLKNIFLSAVIKYILFNKFLGFMNYSLTLFLLHNFSRSIHDIIFNKMDFLKDFDVELNSGNYDNSCSSGFIKIRRVLFEETLKRNLFSDLTKILKVSFLKKDKNKVSELKILLNEICAEIQVNLTNDQRLFFVTNEMLNFCTEFENISFDFSEKQYICDLFLSFFETFGLLTTVRSVKKDLNFANKKKAPAYCFINMEHVTEFFNSFAHYNPFPSIVPPSDWELSSDDTLVLGGYKINKDNLFSCVSLNSLDRVKFSRSTQESLNYIQSVPIKIDKTYLEFVSNNFVIFLLYFLNYTYTNKLLRLLFNTTSNNCFLDFDIQDGFDWLSQKKLTLTIVSEEEFLLRVSETMKSSISITEVKLFYHNTVKKIMIFLDIYLTAVLFKDYSLYFVWFFDFRLRFYVRNAAGTLNVQGSSFSKSFFSFVGDSFIFPDGNPSIYYINQIKAWENSCLKNSSKGFFYLRYLSNKFLNYVSFDVSASGFQILSALVGFEEGLLLTNFFVLSNSPIKMVKQDFYMFFIRGFVSFLKSKFKDTYTIQKCAFEFHFFTDILIAFDNRAFIKDLLIPFLYSQNSAERVKKILKAVNLSLKTENESKQFSFWEGIQMKRKIAKSIAVSFDIYFSDKFPEMGKLKNFLKKDFIPSSSIIKKRKGIFLKTLTTSSLPFYATLKQEIIQYSYLSVALNRSSTFLLSKATDEFCIADSKRGILANLIHRIDSEILAICINRCREQNIPIVTAHDCFFSLVQNEEKLKTFYYEAFFELLFSNTENILENFLMANKKELTENEVYFINTSKKNINEINMKVKNKLLVRSPFLLTP